MMRIISLNVNGIRSAERKGLSDWLTRLSPWDVLCLQELKAGLNDLPTTLVSLDGMHTAFLPAQKKGYSGVGLLASAPFAPRFGFDDPEFDAEGRYLQADFAGLTVVSVYVPSGSSGEERQQAKYRFLDRFLPHLRSLIATSANAGRELIVCGDVNIAHQEIDLKNWKSNQKNSGFLPEERAWLDRMFAETGLVDVFRTLDPRPEQYTWWSNRGQAWAKNVGWRLDYQFATPAIAATARATSIYKEQRFSDHAPLIIDYDFKLSSLLQPPSLKRGGE
ncbi:MAG: exodeoxyribonuclease III [Proteobacteria bacterium]|nr:exodeoxyribonuclease III [Pseudomonadota bacterium]MCL2309138.1 exodeoxyribonuclease III [Pseudomonadota bacterium]